MASNNVKLVSNDGKEFIMPRDSLKHCGLLREMLDTIGDTGDAIPLPNVDGRTLHMVCEWLKLHEDDDAEYVFYTRKTKPYKRNPKDTELFGPSASDDDRTNLVNAANYLDSGRLLDAVIAEVAILVKDCTVRQLVERLKLNVSHLTEDDLEKVRQDNFWFDL